MARVAPSPADPIEPPLEPELLRIIEALAEADAAADYARLLETAQPQAA